MSVAKPPVAKKPVAKKPIAKKPVAKELVLASRGIAMHWVPNGDLGTPGGPLHRALRLWGSYPGLQRCRPSADHQ